MVCSRREDRLEPDVERIESLLGRRDESSQSRSQIKPLQELTQEEKQRTGLVSRGTKCTHIPGDPFGMLMSWAGNVAHPTDDRIVSGNRLLSCLMKVYCV
jgi:hypothetical protein